MPRTLFVCWIGLVMACRSYAQQAGSNMVVCENAASKLPIDSYHVFVSDEELLKWRGASAAAFPSRLCELAARPLRILKSDRGIVIQTKSSWDVSVVLHLVWSELRLVCAANRCGASISHLLEGFRGPGLQYFDVLADDETQSVVWLRKATAPSMVARADGGYGFQSTGFNVSYFPVARETREQALVLQHLFLGRIDRRMCFLDVRGSQVTFGDPNTPLSLFACAELNKRPEIRALAPSLRKMLEDAWGSDDDESKQGANARGDAGIVSF